MRLAEEADPIEQIEAHLTQALNLAEALIASRDHLTPTELIDLTDCLGASSGILRHLRSTYLGTPSHLTSQPQPVLATPEPGPVAVPALPPIVTPAPAKEAQLPVPVVTTVAEPPRAPVTTESPDEELIEQWRRHLAAASYAQTTQRLRVSHIARLAVSAPGLTTTTTRQLEQFMTDFGRTNGPGSLKTFQSSIRSFYGWLVSAELRTTDPTKALLRVRVPHVEGRTVSDAQIAAGLAIATPAERAMILLGREAGLRREEIATLRVADLEGTTLRVRGKGGKVRRVPAAERLRIALQAIESDATEYYFPGKFSGHVHVDQVHAMIRRTVNVNPHALRHAAANSAYARTRDIQAVAAFLGHSSIATTQTYLHLHESQMRALADAVALSDDPS